MNREELKNYLGVTGYSLGQIEKDYFQHIILGSLSRKMAGALVFKGGTALQKTGVTPRFSEDLDFTLRGDAPLKKLEETTTRAIRTYNYNTEVDKFTDDERTLGFRIKIQGPLYRSRFGICTIRIEASKREETILSPENREIAPPYSDILPYVIDIMQLDEIAAEKIRAIFTRNKARDLYDLYKLIEHGIHLNPTLVDRKLEYYETRFDDKKFLARCKVLIKGWDRELASLMEHVPQKDKALDAVKRTIAELQK